MSKNVKNEEEDKRNEGRMKNELQGKGSRKEVGMERMKRIRGIRVE